MFSLLLQDAERRGVIQGIVVVRRAPRVCHLFFADDSLIFCKASEVLMGIGGILGVYECSSRQTVNFEKSQMVFNTNVIHECQLTLAGILNVCIVKHLEKYLGLPSVLGHSKKIVFQGILEKIWTRLLGWKEKLLSTAGKEVLIKAVLQSIPTYVMQCFLLPINLLRQIQVAFTDFWWFSPHWNKIHWLAWDTLCTSK
ncbi:UNVERIFIED_CONTAM: putative ribonuclease H protein [Sesamum calycinum]|uniref:Ribonuclease H protein n=1 Tax=Sesamum calycinum TaxID=2727403 RepID=A0AAW2LZ92_9LAMI